MPLKDADVAQLNLIDQLVYAKTGQSLTNLQRLILGECWQPEKKTYEEIAAQNNYSGRYIQQRVAPTLWHLMTEIVGEKVTKSNCRNVLARYLKSLDGDKISVTATYSALSASPPTTDCSIVRQASGNDSATYKPSDMRRLLELPAESVPLDSRLYIPREPHEQRCIQLIGQPGALIRIKGPRQMGKTSLMNRIIAAKAYPAIVLNFQQIEQSTLVDLDKLLRWLCANITRQLKLPLALDDCWDEDIGSKMSCTLYIEEYILNEIDTPLILALEESSELFEHIEVAKAFFGMIRTWHEYTKHQEVWQKLRLILVQSTETYVPLNINQSPFNVGFEVALKSFTQEQVATLAKLNGLSLTEQDYQQLMALLAGHPYLVRLALYYLAQGTTTWEHLFNTASSDQGIFSHHLQRHLWSLQHHAELGAAFRDVLNERVPVRIGQTQGFKLHSMGLVTLIQNKVQISCELYQRYFSEHL